jgi:hypothetical protein
LAFSVPKEGLENDQGVAIGQETDAKGRNVRAESDPSVRIATAVGPNAAGALKGSERPLDVVPAGQDATVEGALRLAVKIAVDRGDYKRAAEVLELLQRRPSGIGV